MSYSLIIPVYNEEISVRKLLSQLKILNHQIEIIIINDGSTDRTKEILESNNDHEIINSPRNKGKGSSIIKGVKIAKNNNIILMDGDLEIDIRAIPELIKKHESQSDKVILGSRWNNKSNLGSGINTYGNYFFNFLFNKLYKTELKDVLCCLKILNKDLFKSLNIKSTGFSIEIEIMSKLALSGSKFLEIDVIYNRRSKSEGKKLKTSDGWNILWKMLMVKIKGN